MMNILRSVAVVSVVLVVGSVIVQAQDKPRKPENKVVKVGKLDPKKYTSALNPKLRPTDAKKGASYWNGVAYTDGCICDSDGNLWCKDANGDWQYAGECGDSSGTMASKMSDKKVVKVGKLDPKKYTSALNPKLRPTDAKKGASYWNGVAYTDGCICDSDGNLWCKDANGDWQYAGECGDSSENK